MKRTIALGFGAVLLVIALTGCGGSAKQSTSSDQPSAAAASKTPTPTNTPETATELATGIKTKTPTVTQVVTITEDNDPNSLIGRPNEYTDAAVIYDNRVACSDGLGADCGATIEVWPTVALATARSQYIQTALQAAGGVLGTEYDTVSGNYLLRVAGELKPSDADAYKAAFLAQLGS